MFTDFYPMIKRWTLRCTVPYPSSSSPSGAAGPTPFFNSTLNLIFNPALEHSCDWRYWSCYDLMSNAFGVEESG